MSPAKPNRAFEQARAHFKQGQYREAERVLRALVRHNPADFDALTLLAGCLSLDGKHAEAATFEQMACEAEPSNPQAWSGLGWDLLKAGDLDGAEDAFRRCLELDPEQASAHHHLARIAMLRGDADLAKERLREALQLRPEVAESVDEDPELRPLLDDPDIRRILAPKDDPSALYEAVFKEMETE